MEMYRNVKYLPVFRAIECELQQEQYRPGILVVTAEHGPLGIPLEQLWCCPVGHKVHFTSQH
jgi:hypothetical protein